MMNRYQFISITLHFLILMLAMLVLQPMISSKPLGEQQAAVIHAYMQTHLQTKATFSMTKPIKKIEEKNKSIVKQVRQSKVSSVKQTDSLQSKQSKQSNRQETSGERIDELLSMLHHTIQQVQQYPASAEALGREGRATIAFKLLLNGDVTNVILQHSSGVGSLDQAALLAVKTAAPFHGVNRYLSEPRSFAIDVVFALS